MLALEYQAHFISKLLVVFISDNAVPQNLFVSLKIKFKPLDILLTKTISVIHLLMTDIFVYINLVCF